PGPRLSGTSRRLGLGHLRLRPERRIPLLEERVRGGDGGVGSGEDAQDRLATLQVLELEPEAVDLEPIARGHELRRVVFVLAALARPSREPEPVPAPVASSTARPGNSPGVYPSIAQCASSLAGARPGPRLHMSPHEPSAARRSRFGVSAISFAVRPPSESCARSASPSSRTTKIGYTAAEATAVRGTRGALARRPRGPARPPDSDRARVARPASTGEARRRSVPRAGTRMRRPGTDGRGRR